MSEVKVYNPDDTPVFIAGPFTSVGGHEWATVRYTKEVRSLIEGGHLVCPEGTPDADDDEESKSDSKQEAKTSGDTSPRSKTTTNKKG
jgi:hypothetical protein